MIGQARGSICGREIFHTASGVHADSFVVEPGVPLPGDKAAGATSDINPELQCATCFKMWVGMVRGSNPGGLDLPHASRPALVSTHPNLAPRLKKE